MTEEKNYYGWQPIDTAPFSTWIIVSNGKRTGYMVMDDYEGKKYIWMERTPEYPYCRPSFKPKSWFNHNNTLPPLRKQIGTGEFPEGFDSWDEWEKANGIAPETEEPDAIKALEGMKNAYKDALQTGYDRIKDLGGDCDSPGIMMIGDHRYLHAVAVLSAAKKGA